MGSIFPLPQEDHVVDRYRVLIAPFLAAAPGLEHFNIPHLGLAAQDACYALLDHVSAFCERVSRPDHPQAIGLGNLAKLTELRAFSLNYDDIPYQSSVNFYDGWKGGQFRPGYPWPLDLHTLCQLHGSVLWGNHPASPFELHKFDSRAEASTHRKSRGGMQHFMDNHEAANAPMITGLRKADRIMARPYGAYFHIFRDELLRCPDWLIVGYGFRDPHVNQALLQARANWMQRGASQRILVVDRHGFDLADADGYERVTPGSGLSERLYQLLGGTFREDVLQFHAPLAPLVRRGTLNRLSDDLAIWLDGAQPIFTTEINQLLGWFQLP